MPRYPYFIQTIYGNSYPYDTETNVSAWQPPNTMLLIHNPLPATRIAKRFYVVQPVASTGGLKLGDGTIAPLEQISHLYGTQIDVASNGAPVFMGYPIDEADIKDKKNMTLIQLPGLVLPIWVIVLVCIAVIMAALSIIVPSVLEYLKQMHAFDMAAHSQDTIERSYIDVDSGEQQSQYFEGADIERRTFRNGEILDIPLNQKGQDYNIATCGKAICTVNEGVDMEELANTIITTDMIQGIITWIVIGAIAIGGIYVAVKVLPSFLERRRQPQYLLPPQYRRAPGIEYVE